MTKSDLLLISEEFFVDERKIISFLKQSYSKTFNIDKKRIISFDFKDGVVLVNRDNRIAINCIGSFQRTKKWKNFLNNFRDLLKEHKRVLLKTNLCIKNKYMSDIFNGKKIVTGFFDSTDEKRCFFYLKNSIGERQKNIILYCKKENMFETDILEKDNNFVLKIKNIRLKKGVYYISCSRNNDKDIIDLDFKNNLEFIIDKIFNDDKEIKQILLKSFKIRGIKIQNFKGVVNVECIDMTYLKHIRKIFFILENYKKNLEIKIYWR
ncbi:hypothetical protein CQA57_07060 [Helicobacter anseris]|uniref:Uncharacterized protein n=1 Tax=Helicobacter anseris TaxID=375926 RepID=A0A3D8J5D3_9HELI|nr:hypothetical protein [Helicobacter anseris]RDU72355.1 hypothetical protein CQA57_07060 [Helicobacter anseris]